MTFWRLRWALGEFANSASVRTHARVLANPWDFYKAVVWALPVHRHRHARPLRLKSGHSIRVREFMTLYIYNEIFARGCYDVQFSDPAPLIVDVGANTGLFALRMKQLYPCASIVCFEPFPPNFRELEMTISENGLNRVRPVRKAVGAYAEVRSLFIHNKNVGGHSFFADLAGGKGASSIDVEVISLETALGDLGRKIDLLKLDCEGAEHEVLKGMTAEVAASVERILIEPTPALYTIEELKGHVHDLGYRSSWRNGLYLFERVAADAAEGAA